MILDTMTSYFNGVTAALRFAKDYAIAAGAYVFASKTHTAMPTLTPLDAVSRLSPLVTRILGQNPGPFTLQGTNTYLVGGGKKKILIDTGEPSISEYISLLKSTLEEDRSEIDSIIITHWHNDHVGGIPGVVREVIGHEEDRSEIDSIIITHWHNDHVGGIPGVVREVIGHEVPIYKIQRGTAEDPSRFHYVSEGHEIHVEGATLRFVQTPGHTADHTSLYLEEEQTLFSGDCILGEGTTVFEDLHDYMKSLDKIKGMHPKRIYPGHGPVVEKCDEKVDEYVKHRMQRENQIVDALRSLGEATSMDLTVLVYKVVAFSF
ncbi:metallo-beta-lactamase domain protein [Oesophagostomum dentatum]|uniref:Metallo-beta-lactamase domain protein n=1 Tax=Oesophagostomum dentatum TaxID=61180 RepID=A0A0B1TUA1_OESDE|nr:metallo-beta-lactamase domain protein [Oesophagostomum dentatum]